MPKGEDTMPPLTGCSETQPITEIRREVCPRGDETSAARGVCRALVLGVALWGIVAVVAVAIGAAGDAQDAATPHTTVVRVDRGGHH